jgi:hypothetical protein
MNLSNIITVFTRAVGNDLYTPVLIDKERVSRTLVSCEYASILPDDYIKFISSSIPEVPSHWELYGVTKESCQLEYINKDSWVNGVPNRYTVFGSVWAGEEYLCFDHASANGRENASVVTGGQTADEFAAETLECKAATFSDYLSDSTYELINGNLKRLYGFAGELADTLNSFGAQVPHMIADEDATRVFRRFSNICTNDHGFECEFLRSSIIARTSIGSLGLPHTYSLMEKWIKESTSTRGRIKYATRHGRYFGDNKDRLAKQSGVINSNTNLFAFCILNNNEVYAFGYSEGVEPNHWPVYQLTLDASGGAHYPILYARSHYEFIIKVLQVRIDCRIKEHKILENELMDML